MQPTLTRYLENFRRRGDEIAYVHRRGYRTVRWTYAATAAAASRFARELESRGIAKGEKVLIWGDNCAEWVVVFLGCMLRGVQAVPLDVIASPGFVLRIGQQVDARLCVCSRALSQHEIQIPCLILED